MGGKGSGRQGPVIPQKRKDEIHEAFNPIGEEITVAEWLKVAKDIPEIRSILVTKYVGGSWSRMEDLDTIGPGFNPEGVEAFVASTFKDGRFRLEARGDMGIIVSRSPIMYVGSWEHAESVARQPTNFLPVSNISPAAGVAKKIEERVEAQTMMTLVEKLDDVEARRVNEKAFGPLTVATQMMDMFQKVLDRPKDDSGVNLSAILQMMMGMQQANTTLMVEMMRLQMQTGEKKESALGTITEIVKVLDAVRGGLGDLLAGGDRGGSDWQEGLKIAMPLLQEAVRKWPSPNGPAVVPQSSRILPPTQPSPVPSEVSDDEMESAMADPRIKKLIEIIINALKSQDYRTANAILMNLKDGSGAPLIVIDPDAQPIAYAAMLGLYDPRFEAMEREIAAFFDWMKEQNAPEPEDEPAK